MLRKIIKTVTDSFDNTGTRLWWVPMEFTHDFIDGTKARFTFDLKVAGDDEDDARSKAATVSLEDILPDVYLDEFDADEIVNVLDDDADVTNPSQEDWSNEDDDIELQVNCEADVEECDDCDD